MTVSFILYMNVAPINNLFIREAGSMLDLILAKLFMLPVVLIATASI